MGDVKEDDEVAAETWDDEGCHLASRRRGTVRDNSNQALQENRNEVDDGPPATSPLLTSTPRSRGPHQIAHFPPLRYSATHTVPYNLVHRLGPKQSSDAGLVKRVAVEGVIALPRAGRRQCVSIG